ncbi:hypothetical protein [uncultured Propionivibrio sp.]|uniref:hypothetical protein n=1 Tax=uncultured Propionivibrio sp. TaxID=426737 RepID=UPI0029C0E834|nr:hypothetical protein [uncultured Propionivibrio sp.]
MSFRDWRALPRFPDYLLVKRIVMEGQDFGLVVKLLAEGTGLPRWQSRPAMLRR